MSKSLHIVSLPTITTSGDISPWKDVLEGIGFTVDTTAGKAIWKDSGMGFRISGTYVYAYKPDGYNVVTIFSNIVNATVNFRYIKFNENDIAFSIADGEAREYVDNIICKADTDWLIISNASVGSALVSGYVNQPDNYSKQFGYTNGEIILVPFIYKSLKPQNVYTGVCMPNIGVKKSYICSVGNKKYFYTRTHATNTYPGFAIDVDAIWDDSDY